MKRSSIGPRESTVKNRRFAPNATKSRNSALDWAKSSLSHANGSCVEVSGLSGNLIRVRDSKDAEGPILCFTPAEWDAFLGGVQMGEFDRVRRDGTGP
jgi:hypothetical protein